MKEPAYIVKIRDGYGCKGRSAYGQRPGVSWGRWRTFCAYTGPSALSNAIQSAQERRDKGGLRDVGIFHQGKRIQP